MHPYEMIRLMRQRRDDRLVAITNGTLYHTVGRLERAGLVTEVGIDRHGNRPERTTYALTSGRARSSEWVRRELPRIDRPGEFRIALAEAHNLDRDEVIALLRTRRAALAAAQSSSPRASARPTPRGTRAVPARGRAGSRDARRRPRLARRAPRADSSATIPVGRPRSLGTLSRRPKGRTAMTDPRRMPQHPLPAIPSGGTVDRRLKKTGPRTHGRRSGRSSSGSS